jgi:hypothetical protein
MTYTILPLKLKTVISKPHSFKGSTYDSTFFLLVLGISDAGKRKKRVFQPRDPWKTKVQKKRGEKR